MFYLERGTTSDFASGTGKSGGREIAAFSRAHETLVVKMNRFLRGQAVSTRIPEERKTEKDLFRAAEVKANPR